MTVPTGEAAALRRRHRLLQQRSARLQQDNERLVHRIYQVKRLTKRYKKEIKFLMARLDMHGDAFRTVKTEEDIKPDISTLQQCSGYSPIKTERSTPNKSGTSDRYSTGKKSSVKRKTSTNDRNRDSSSSKKPTNAFNQYYQEQGPLVIAEGNTEAGSRWKTLSNDDKKARAAVFERLK